MRKFKKNCKIAKTEGKEVSKRNRKEIEYKKCKMEKIKSKYD